MAETKMLVWTVEGEPCAGSLADYAHSREGGNYSGLDVSATVWAWDGSAMVEREVTISASSFDSDDWARVVCFFDGQEASYRIDGRT